MRLLIDDSFATSVFTAPVRSGWISAPGGLEVSLVPRLNGAAIDADSAALAPSTALTRLATSHVVMRDIAAISQGIGDIALRTPVRPDEIDQSPVRLFAAGELAETLARAVLGRFYGITPTNWIRDETSPEAARAQVVIVEGAEALREPEGGFSEDLARAWFILTALPVVTHVALAPRSAPATAVNLVTEFLAQLRDTGLSHRGEWIPALVEREDLPRDRASAFWAAQRLTLVTDDERAVIALLRDGRSDTAGVNLASVQFISGSELV